MYSCRPVFRASWHPFFGQHTTCSTPFTCCTQQKISLLSYNTCMCCPKAHTQGQPSCAWTEPTSLCACLSVVLIRESDWCCRLSRTCLCWSPTSLGLCYQASLWGCVSSSKGGRAFAYMYVLSCMPCHSMYALSCKPYNHVCALKLQVCPVTPCMHHHVCPAMCCQVYSVTPCMRR